MQDLKHRSHYIDQLNESLIGNLVTVSGWIEDIRDIGRLVFVVIRDSTGAIQALARDNNAKVAKEIPRQSSVTISGLQRRVMPRTFSLRLASKTFLFIQGQTILCQSMLREESVRLLTNVLILELWI
jgi:nondiscriminating aspartyl-tRNA synthetase